MKNPYKKSLSARLISLVFILSISSITEIYSQNDKGQYGSLLVICEEGFRVYIDDEFKGITQEEQDGLYIQKIDTGFHAVTIKKSDIKDYTFNIKIIAGKTAEHEYDMSLQEEDKSDKALVYIFRPARMRGAWVPYTVYVDEETISEYKLSNKSYLSCWVDAGEHRFWHGLYGGREEVVIDCKAGETYYIKAKTDRFSISTKEVWDEEKDKLKRLN